MKAMRTKHSYHLSAFLVASLLCITVATVGQAKKLTASEARDHIGERAMVCGKVVSSRYASSTRGAPTFLDLDKPYPNNLFTIVIWGENRAKFGAPEETYRDKSVCVTGNITSYRSSPEIVASDPSQIVVDTH
jgi:hypothetical protein